MGPIKIGVFGVGHLGKIHLKCLENTPFEIVGYCDPNQTIDTDIKKYESGKLMLQEVDAVVIASTTESHAGLIVNAIEQKKHIFVEKPFVSNEEDSQRIREKLEGKDLIFQVGHVERYNPAYRYACKYDLTPGFIEGHRLAPFNLRGTDVNVVLDLMIHDLDLVLDLVDAEVKEIQANGVAVVSDSIDICNARISFKNGTTANLTASRISIKQMRKLRLFQSDMYMSIDLLNKQTQIFKLEDATDDDNGIVLDLGDKKKAVVMESFDQKDHNAIEEELNDFHNSIVNNTRPRVGFKEAYNSLALANMILEKVRQNGQP